ncbi:MAG: hypothetical protein IJL71_06015, partial [Oscillospiraceae bacterium]|nr:hypothetical protein [Oscillospiraceae bacterium]
ERLTAYKDFRGTVPIETIYLYDITGITPAAAMSERKADMILYDTSAGTLDVYTDHETRYFESTILQFIGFDTTNSVLRHSVVRRAMSHLVNREDALADYSSGSTVAATQIMSPASPGYDATPKAEADYSVRKFTDILNEQGATDSNGDGWLEFDGSTMDFDFIVCKDSPNAVSAASEIALSMRNVGLKIDLQALDYEDYMIALMKGDFDMYYGEVRLPANFDLTEILGSEGSLNFGHYSGFDEALSAWLTAKGDEEKAEASSALCGLVCEEAPVIPVCYRKNAVAIPRGRISGMEPGQQCLFRGFENWEINLRS